MPHSFTAIFCEDIREEVGGTHSLIGIMPDNITLASEHPRPTVSAILFPKLGIYTRINLDVTAPPNAPVSGRIVIPGLADLPLGEVDLGTIQKAYEDAKASGISAAGLIFKTVLSPIHFKKAGLITVYATVDGVERVCGSLNVIIPTLPNA